MNFMLLLWQWRVPICCVVTPFSSLSSDLQTDQEGYASMSNCNWKRLLDLVVTSGLNWFHIGLLVEHRWSSRGSIGSTWDSWSMGHGFEFYCISHCHSHESYIWYGWVAFSLSKRIWVVFGFTACTDSSNTIMLSADVRLARSTLVTADPQMNRVLMNKFWGSLGLDFPTFSLLIYFLPCHGWICLCVSFQNPNHGLTKSFYTPLHLAE